MSRSKRKTPIFGRGGASEKKDKRINNRMFRKKEQTINSEIKKEVLGSSGLSFIELDVSDIKYPINMDEVRSVWAMNKDGKTYWNNAPIESLRK